MKLNDNPEDAPNFFHKMVDELVEFAEFDSELKEGMQWLDSEAYKKNISFYDMVFQILYKHDMNEASLTTVNNPVVDGNDTYDELVDMEALEIWNILKSMIPNDRFIFLKVISDYMENKCLNIKSFEKLATKILTYQLIPITNLLNILQEIEINDHSALNINEK